MRLTIRIGSNALSFSARRPDGTVAYEPYHVKCGVSMAANLRQAFSDSHLLAGGYKSALVLMDSPVLLIPMEEYREEDVPLLYTTAYKADRSSAVLHSVIPEVDAVAAFSMNKDLRMVLNDNFDDVAIIPLMQPVWKWLYRRSFTGMRRKLYAYVHEKRLELFGFRQNRFSFCNTFDAAQGPDAAYCLLAVWKQMGMKADTDELHVIGAGTGADSIPALAREYIRNVVEDSAGTEFPELAPAMPAALPFDLYTLYAKKTCRP